MRTSKPAAAQPSALRHLLEHERNDALARVRDLRKAQEQDATPPPGDELDAARTLADVETHAGLIERAEDRLKAIDEAFARLERGVYGVCEECGEQIPTARLKALPFAKLCVDCQSKHDPRLRLGEGKIDEPSRHHWTPPEEMNEPPEKPDAMTDPEERLAVREESPLGPEVDELEQAPRTSTIRKRGRAKKQAPDKGS